MRPNGRRGIAPERESLYMPIDGDTAILILIAATAAFLVLGMIVFARKEYRNLT